MMRSVRYSARYSSLICPTTHIRRLRVVAIIRKGSVQVALARCLYYRPICSDVVLVKATQKVGDIRIDQSRNWA
jgi:hypothetical protein